MVATAIPGMAAAMPETVAMATSAAADFGGGDFGGGDFGGFDA